MSLESLNEKLYGRDVHFDRAKHPTAFDPKQSTENTDAKAEFQKKEAWQAPVIERAPLVDPSVLASTLASKKRKKKIALILGAIALIILVVGAVLKVRGMLFNEGNVSVEISGPQNAASVEETTFTIVYTNDNWGGLDNATLLISYPDSFHVEASDTLRVNGPRAEIALGTIPANESGKAVFKGKFYGSKGDRVNIQATLRYSPNNVSTVLEKTTSFLVTIASAPLSLEIAGPLDLATGQALDYVIDYSNTSDKPFSNVRVKMEYPDGFQVLDTLPKPSEGDSVWYIGDLNTDMRGKIVVHGVLTGTKDEYKRVRGSIGTFESDGTFVAYAVSERQTHIIASPLSLSQTVNRLTEIAVNPGERLQYDIQYRNDGTFGVRDAIITVEIDPTYLAMNRLTLPKGAYDAVRKVIVWKASDIPALGKLEPGASGSVSFSVVVLDSASLVGGKELSIKTVAKIDSLDIPTPLGANKVIGSNTLLVKLKSQATISAKVLYTDTTFPNSGPIPPKVGQETSYTLYLSVANSLNDLKQARLTANLPTGIKFTGKYAPTGEVFSYNERSNALSWDMGTLASGSTPREIAFQVSVLPGPNQERKMLTLLNNIVFTGQDTFTGQDVRAEKEKVENALREDSVYGGSFGDASTVQKAD